MKNTFLILSFFFSLLIGCAEKPKSVGNGLPNPDGLFAIDTISFLPSGDTTYKTIYVTGYGSSTLAGKLPLNGESIAMIKFTPTSNDTSILKKIDTIDYAELSLVVNYRSNITTVPVQLNVNLIKSSWAEGSFTSDTLLTLDPKVMATFSDSMKFGATIKTRLDTADFRKWINNQIDSTKDKFYGFAVSGINPGIVGFTPFNIFSFSVPRLFIKFINEGKPDSITISYGEDTYSAKYSIVPVLNPITVHAAFGVRSKINFNVGSLVNKPIINNAILELTLDSSASTIEGFSPDSVIALVGLSNSITDSSSGTLFSYGYRKSSALSPNPVYSFNLTGIAQRWVNNINQNYGLTLRWAAELSTVEKAVFYSSTNPDVNKRPKLKITYSKK